MPLPQARSEVWQYFGFLADDNGQIVDKTRVICRLCALSFCYSGNTTNFYSHLRAIHSDINLKRSSNAVGKTPTSISNSSPVRAISPVRTISSTPKAGTKRAAPEADEPATFDEFQENHEPSTSKANSDGTKNANDEYYVNSNKITESLVNFVVNDCRPVDVLYGQGFQKLINLLAPGYLLPKKSSLLMELRRRYDELQKEKNIQDIDKSLAS